MQLMRRFLGCALAVLVFRAGAADSTNNASEGLNRFATAAYAKLAAGHSNNLIFSPYSLHVALTMAAAGARGETERQLATVLGGTADERARNAQKIGISLGAAHRGGLVSISLANRIWIDRSVAVLPGYATDLKTSFGASLSSVDFRNDPLGAGAEIDAWVWDKTRNKIAGLIGGNPLSTNTALVLANAIYFQGSWATRFKRSETRTDRFRLDVGRSVEIPMMYMMMERACYGETNGVQMLSIPYRGDRFSLVVLLPRLGGLPALEHVLANEGLAGFPAAPDRVDVKLWLPRFEVGSKFEVSKTISDLGAPRVFTMEAELGGISPGAPLHISAVCHAARILVNEEGTEAAAATIMPSLMESLPPPPPEFRADHPFVYAIYDRETRAILFLGRLMDPRS